MIRIFKFVSDSNFLGDTFDSDFGCELRLSFRIGQLKLDLQINNLSRVMRKQTFYICEHKDADQLHGDREADQRLCFRYKDTTIPLLSKSEISSLKPSSVAIQPGLCRTWSETRTLVFSRRG